jgi:hypothetical protein
MKECIMKNPAATKDDRWKVIEGVTRFFTATDNRNWTMVRDCFDESVLFDMGSL